jgi:hypothetical protein
VEEESDEEFCDRTTAPVPKWEVLAGNKAVWAQLCQQLRLEQGNLDQRGEDNPVLLASGPRGRERVLVGQVQRLRGSVVGGPLQFCGGGAAKKTWHYYIILYSNYSNYS